MHLDICNGWKHIYNEWKHEWWDQLAALCDPRGPKVNDFDSVLGNYYEKSDTVAHCDKLTHWGRVTYICVSELTIIGSDNGLSPEWHQAIIWTSAGILLIGHLGTNFSEISIAVQTFSFKKMHLKMSSAKWRPLCLSLNVLTHGSWDKSHKMCAILQTIFLNTFPSLKIG